MRAAVTEAPSAGTWLTARRAVWLLAIVAAVVVGLLAVRLTQSFNARNAVSNKIGIPVVSVTEVGRTAVPTTISIIGTIAARYDTPIGAEGDGGRVAAIYVEAGDRVKRGQVLARLDVSVLQPQVVNLQAALELSRAEADLAAAARHRDQEDLRAAHARAPAEGRAPGQERRYRVLR